jgi:hypothetical protein
MPTVIVVAVHSFELYFRSSAARLSAVLDLFFAEIYFLDELLSTILRRCLVLGSVAIGRLSSLRSVTVAPSTSAATTTASAPPARPAFIILSALCRFSGVLFGSAFCFAHFIFDVIVFFDVGGTLLLDDEPVGLGDARSCDLHITKIIVLVFFLEVEEVGHVKEGIALQAYIDECRLHAWKHARNSSFVDGSREGVFVSPLVVNLGKLIVFQQRDFRLVRRGRYVKFLVHLGSGPLRILRLRRHRTRKRRVRSRDSSCV